MYKMTIAVFLGVLSLHSYAQESSINSYFRDNMYVFDGLDKIMDRNFFINYANDLGVTSDDEFQVQECNNQENGRFDCRYFQYHKGYLVEGSSFILHGQTGVVFYAAGNQIKNLNVNVANPISESEALELILDSLSGNTFEWEVDSIMNGYREMLEDSLYSTIPHGELLISKPSDAEYVADNYSLKWKFIIPIVYPNLQNLTVYIDAITGEVNSIQDSKDYGHYGTGTVQTMYDGSRTFRTWKCDLCTNWKLASDQNNIVTYQGNSGVLKDHDNNWSSWDERPTTTTHWALERAWNYYANRHGRNGSNNQGMSIVGRADYNNPYDPVVYAAYDQVNGVDNVYVGPRINNISPAALDVIGHEFSHGFIKRNPGLSSANDEAGILNEGFADIFGLLIERSVRGTGHNWKVGEDINFNNPVVRNFADPHASTPNPQPAKYQEAGYWVTSGTGYKHRNAGVLTHWFYLLSQGGTYNGVNVGGVGIEQADDIAFTTMMWWLWGNCNFMDARNQSIYATIADWGGKCSNNHKQVLRAWSAVGLGSYYIRCLPRSIEAPMVVDKATMGGIIKPFKGKLIKTDPSDETEIEPHQITWMFPSSWDVSVSEDKLEFEVNSVSSFESQIITAFISNEEGIDTITHIVHFVDCESGDCDNNTTFKIANQGTRQAEAKPVTVYPNPTRRGSVNILLPDDASESISLSIYDISGSLMKTSLLNQKQVVVDVSDLNSGVYIFRVVGATFSESVRVIVQN